MKLSLLLLLSIIALACTSGCASYYVNYEHDAKAVYNIWPETECKGSVGVTRESGMMHFGVCGPCRKREFYGIFFKRGTAYPEEFYFTVADGYHTRIAESKGRVLVGDGSVTINVRYRDSSGLWVSPPINGRHKIDSISP